MAGQEALLCPSCGARNKRTWEYCARCGESLQGAVAEAAPAAAKTQVAPRAKGKSKGKLNILVREREPESSMPPGVILGVGVVILVGLGFAGWRYASSAPPPQAADPSLFAIPTLPSARPAAPVAPSEPGGADYNEGLRLMAAGKAAEAIPFLSRASSAAPSNATFLWVWGQALLATGAQDDALVRFADAARVDPKAHGLEYARALDKAGRSADAAAAFEAAGASGNDAAQEELGKLYYKAGNFAKAAPLLDKAVAARSDDPVLRQELAYAVAQTGDKARAVELYRSVLTIAPGADISRGLLSELLLDQGKGPDAMALLQEGVQLNPEAPALRRRLGSIAERTGNAQEALKQYREYVRLAPNAPDAKELAERAARLEGAGKT